MYRGKKKHAQREKREGSELGNILCNKLWYSAYRNASSNNNVLISYKNSLLVYSVHLSALLYQFLKRTEKAREQNVTPKEKRGQKKKKTTK